MHVLEAPSEDRASVLVKHSVHRNVMPNDVGSSAFQLHSNPHTSEAVQILNGLVGALAPCTLGGKR